MAERAPDNLEVALSDLATIAALAVEEIGVVARLALDHLETPQGCNSASELIAKALAAICTRAEIAHDDINSMAAEQAGCEITDRRRDRRIAAQVAASTRKGSGHG